MKDGVHRTTDNMSAVFYGPGMMKLEDRVLTLPGTHEVVIRVETCGVCGTDFHIASGEAPARAPVVLGHEYCGQVVEVGDMVRSVYVGDWVAIDPNMPCGQCAQCRLGQPHLCSSLEALGVTKDGGFAAYSVAPESQCHRIPEGLSPVEGAFAEPVACCVHGIALAGIQAGDDVVIFGAGPIGLILMQLALGAGAARVVVSEPVASRRDLAMKLGAACAVDPSDMTEEEIRAEIAVMVPHGARVVIETAGRADTVRASVSVAARGGAVLLFAVAPEKLEVPISPFEIYRKELRIQGSYVNPYTFSRGLSMLASGKVNVKPLVERDVALDELPEILSSGRSSGGAKLMVRPNLRRHHADLGSIAQ